MFARIHFQLATVLEVIKSIDKVILVLVFKAAVRLELQTDSAIFALAAALLGLLFVLRYRYKQFRGRGRYLFGLLLSVVIKLIAELLYVI